jgi:hypothetical protein
MARSLPPCAIRVSARWSAASAVARGETLSSTPVLFFSEGRGGSDGFIRVGSRGRYNCGVVEGSPCNVGMAICQLLQSLRTAPGLVCCGGAGGWPQCSALECRIRSKFSDDLRCQIERAKYLAGWIVIRLFELNFYDSPYRPNGPNLCIRDASLDLKMSVQAIPP